MRAKTGLVKRVIALFTERRTWVRQIAVAGLAGATSWLVGDFLINSTDFALFVIIGA